MKNALAGTDVFCPDTWAESAWEGCRRPGFESLTDSQGLGIVNFWLPCNLMLAILTRIVEGGLEACLQLIFARSAVA